MDRLKKIAVLGFIRLIADIAKPKKQSRVNSIYRRLTREIDKNIRLFTDGLNDFEREKIQKWAEKFGEITKWDKKERDICTYISFCCMICERYSLSNKILSILNELYNHFDRVGKTPLACNWAGVEAADKLERIFNE